MRAFETHLQPHRWHCTLKRKWGVSLVLCYQPLPITALQFRLMCSSHSHKILTLQIWNGLDCSCRSLHPPCTWENWAVDIGCVTCQWQVASEGKVKERSWVFRDLNLVLLPVTTMVIKPTNFLLPWCVWVVFHWHDTRRLSVPWCLTLGSMENTQVHIHKYTWAL